MRENPEKIQEKKWWQALELTREALDIIDSIDLSVFPNADIRTNELLDCVNNLHKDYNEKVFGNFYAKNYT